MFVIYTSVWTVSVCGGRSSVESVRLSDGRLGVRSTATEWITESL